MWTDIEVAVIGISNIACVCLGFYLGRITQEKASGPRIPRVFPDKAAEPDEDVYYGAMYGEDREPIQTAEDTK